MLRAADGTGRGADLGWDIFEGDERFEDPGPTDGWPDDDAAAGRALHTYPHDGRCSIIRRLPLPGFEDLPPWRAATSSPTTATASCGRCGPTDRSRSWTPRRSAVVSINPDESGEALVLDGNGLNLLSPG